MNGRIKTGKKLDFLRVLFIDTASAAAKHSSFTCSDILRKEYHLNIIGEAMHVGDLSAQSFLLLMPITY